MIHPAKLAALALQQVAKVLDRLTEEQLIELAEGRAYVEFRSRDTVVSSGRTRSSVSGGQTSSRAITKTNVDVTAIATAIKAMGTSDEVSAYLDTNDKLFKVDVLKEIARELGPTVSRTGTKPILKRNIVEGTAGFRERAQAVFEQGWQS